MNQRQTWRYEIAGEYLWSPKTNSAGKPHLYYDNMKLLKTGDIVFSYINRAFRYVGWLHIRRCPVRC